MTTGLLGAADAAVDSAGATVPIVDLLAGRIRQMVMLEYDQSTLRQADDTRPSWSGPTRQFDARDSESNSTCQGPTRPWPGALFIIDVKIDFRYY